MLRTLFIDKKKHSIEPKISLDIIKIVSFYIAVDCIWGIKYRVELFVWIIKKKAK